MFILYGSCSPMLPLERRQLHLEYAWVLMLLCELSAGGTRRTWRKCKFQTEWMFFFFLPFLHVRSGFMWPHFHCTFEKGLAGEAGCEGRQRRGRQRCKRRAEHLITRLFMWTTNCMIYVHYYCPLCFSLRDSDQSHTANCCRASQVCLDPSD